ncbi:MAG: YggS family pyridoxal phosphate-dependent enzyme [Firmicutes bacterium]|nr:YggS family pyridoxal phosphate-dependent enzyme [Bacillota bacterium]
MALWVAAGRLPKIYLEEEWDKLGDIAERIAQVRQNIAAALARRGGKPGKVTLVAVSKTVPAERINAAIRAGISVIGENRVQEAREKYPDVDPVKWHFIGHLQRNKVKDVLGPFDLIHSLDRISLAREIQRRAARLNIVVPCLIQVNVAGEKSKFGLAPDDLNAFLWQLVSFPNVRVCGLMTIAPYSTDAERVRPVFRRLYELSRGEGYPAGVSLRYLSMGMSGDYEVAVEEGANMVRIGSAIFGHRTKGNR